MGDTCRLLGCDDPTQDKSGYSGRFCSDAHEMKYDHLKQDARDAKRDAERSRGTPKRDRPECDGPPF